MDLKDIQTGAVLNIGNALKVLECPLLGNGEEWWLYDLLFTPGIHRFQLLKWILSKLNYNFVKTTQLQNSPSEHAENLLPTLTALGFCAESDSDLILGKVSRSKQLKFWKKLIGILWEKYKPNNKSFMSNNSKEFMKEDAEDMSSVFMFTANSTQSSIRSISETCCEIVKKVAADVDIKTLFYDKLDLFPLDVCKDMEKTMAKSDTSECLELSDIIARAKGFNLGDEKTEDSDAVLETSEVSEIEIESEDQRILEEQIDTAFEKNRALRQKFQNFYDDVKPVLKSHAAACDDVGVCFEVLYQKQDAFCQMLNNLSKTKSCFMNFQDEPDLDKDNLLQDQLLSDSDWDEYSKILRQSLKRDENTSDYQC